MLNKKNIFLITLFFATSIFASVANITAIRGDAIVKSISETTQAKLGQELENKDSIITKNKTKVQMIFSDKTIVTIGQNSNFSIENYLLDNQNKPTAEFSLIKGTMRTITGKIGKVSPERFKVKTNNATVGIRGTNFTINVAEVENIFCTYGAISVNVNGNDFVINQGFRLQISQDLSTEIKAFSAKDLKNLNEKSFGKSTTKKGSLDKQKQPTQTTQIDTTIDVNIESVQQDIVDIQQDSIQQQEDMDNDSHIEPTDPPTSETIANIDSWGYTTGNGHVGIYDGQNLKFTWLEFVDQYGNYIDTGVYDAPSSYDESFEASFTDLYKENIDGSFTNGTIGTLNNFRATNDDLSINDDMHWGDWALSYTIDGIYSEETGLWVSGKETSLYGPNIINAYTLNNVEYRGIYKAKDLINDSIVNGSAFMTVNFGSGTASFTINQPNNTIEWASYAMDLYGNELSGTQNTGTGIAIGTFYGETGNSIGGGFRIQSLSEVEAEGVYQLNTTTLTESIEQPVTEQIDYLDSWGYTTGNGHVYTHNDQYSKSTWISFVDQYDRYIEADVYDAPLSFDESFETSFTDLYKQNTDGSFVSGTVGAINSFRVTNDDLSPNDDMHWGDWALSYTADGINSEENGLWIAGKETYYNSIIVSTYTLNNVEYTGIYKAKDLINDSIVNGSAFMTVNFGSGTASFTVNQPNDTVEWASYDMDVYGNELSGTQNTGTGIAIGTFYGETGNSIGGKFIIQSVSEVEAEGVYQLNTTTVLE